MDRAAGAVWGASGLTFRYLDRDGLLAGLRLDQHAGLPAEGLDFTYDAAEGAWILHASHPEAWRLEYRLALKRPDGGTEVVTDPDNPRRVTTAFGELSVVQRPDYLEPEWLHHSGADGGWRELTIPAPTLDSHVWVRVWSPPDRTDLVLVAHDGPEYDRLASLSHYCATMIGSGRVAPHHLVLLAPGKRNEWYSANSAYAKALSRDVLPRVRATLGTARPVVGMGASLGALAMLHAQRRNPRNFEGLFLQSGSFFRPRLDPQESHFEWFRRIIRFTGRVVRTRHAAGTVPVTLTCGRAEENLANNREMAQALRRQGYDAHLAEVPDAHNYTCWRDAFDPNLTALLQRIWAPFPTRTPQGAGED